MSHKQMIAEPVRGVEDAGLRTNDRLESRLFWHQERSILWVLLLASGLYLLLGTLGAATDPWRDDEAFTWNLIQAAPRQMMTRIIADVHPPLFYLVMKCWNHIWHTPEAMKALTLLCGLLALWLAAGVAWLVWGRRTAALTALLWAVFPMFLHYGQDARMYSMVVMLEGVALLGWAIAVSERGYFSKCGLRIGWVLLAGAMTALLYTQNLTLFFVAALAVGEGTRAWRARRLGRLGQSGQPDARQKPGPWWIVSAVAVSGLLYAPWAPVAWRQMHSPAITHIFSAPGWPAVFEKLFYFPFTLAVHWRPRLWWGYVAGGVLIGILPVMHLVDGLLRRGRTGWCEEMGRTEWMISWVAWSPLLFLILYSKRVDPVFEITRHGVMFIPWLLLPAAAWLAGRSRLGVWRHCLPMSLIGGSSLMAVFMLAAPRDGDLSTPRNALLDRAPLGYPIFIYPPVPSFVSLLWDPLPLYPYFGSSEIPETLTACTLIVNQGSGPNRDEIISRTRLTVSRAATGKPIYVTHDFTAYQLDGLPPGELRALLGNGPGLGVDLVGQQVGRWAPAHIFKARDLLTGLKPGGEVVTFSPLNPDWQGVRLQGRETTLRLPDASGAGAGGFSGLMVGGRNISSGAHATDLRVRLDDGPDDKVSLSNGNFALIRLVRDGAPNELRLKIPKDLVSATYVPQGDAPPGIYLVWGGRLALGPEMLRRKEFDGTWLDAGALGDELYLRAGFYEREETPTGNVRWTCRRFELEAPVWPGQAPREVSLFGYLPKEIKSRRVRVAVKKAGAGGQDLSAECAINTADWGQYPITLPAPIPPGVWRLAFELDGAWTPSDDVPGSDGRKLGFYLDGVGLR